MNFYKKVLFTFDKNLFYYQIIKKYVFKKISKNN